MSACYCFKLIKNLSQALVGFRVQCNGHDLAEERDICLGSTDDPAFLVLVIMLFFATKVNRTEDFAAADIKNSAPYGAENIYLFSLKLGIPLNCCKTCSLQYTQELRCHCSIKYRKHIRLAFFFATYIIDLYSRTIWQQFKLYRYYFVIDIPLSDIDAGESAKTSAPVTDILWNQRS